jgi:hypothetical protein
MIHLKRFTNTGEKLKNPVFFPEKFSIDEENLSIFSQLSLTALFNSYQKNQQTISEEDKEMERSHFYNLYAFIVHEGYSS